MLASTPAVAAWLQNQAAVHAPTDLPAGYSRADAIVVLGGGEVLPDDASEQASEVTRLGLGLSLLRAHRAPKILLSGGDGEAAQMAAHLIARGVSEKQILLESRSLSTRENAQYSAPILRGIGAGRILLVTSGIHMRRAAACFAKLGFEVVPTPAPEPPLRNGRDFWETRERALMRSGHCLHELLGLWFYELCGWA